MREQCQYKIFSLKNYSVRSRKRISLTQWVYETIFKILIKNELKKLKEQRINTR